MKKSSFTLVELLVVIGIIGILAGIVLPALGGARASSIRTDCLNNRHQLGLGALQYANDNKQVIPLKLECFAGSKSEAYFSYIIAGKTSNSSSRTTTASVNSYLPDKVLICNEAMVKELDATGSNAVGMLDISLDSNDGRWYNDALKTQGRFRSIIPGKRSKNVIFQLTQMKNPASLVLWADAFNTVGKERKGIDTCAFFLPGNLMVKESGAIGWVTTIHQNSSVVGMADGSASAMTAAELYASSLKLETTLTAGREQTYTVQVQK